MSFDQLVSICRPGDVADVYLLLVGSCWSLESIAICLGRSTFGVAFAGNAQQIEQLRNDSRMDALSFSPMKPRLLYYVRK